MYVLTNWSMERVLTLFLLLFFFSFFFFSVPFLCVLRNLKARMCHWGLISSIAKKSKREGECLCVLLRMYVSMSCYPQHIPQGISSICSVCVDVRSHCTCLAISQNHITYHKAYRGPVATQRGKDRDVRPRASLSCMTQVDNLVVYVSLELFLLVY